MGLSEDARRMDVECDVVTHAKLKLSTMLDMRIRLNGNDTGTNVSSFEENFLLRQQRSQMSRKIMEGVEINCFTAHRINISHILLLNPVSLPF